MKMDEYINGPVLLILQKACYTNNIAKTFRLCLYYIFQLSKYMGNGKWRPINKNKTINTGSYLHHRPLSILDFPIFHIWYRNVKNTSAKLLLFLMAITCFMNEWGFQWVFKKSFQMIQKWNEADFKCTTGEYNSRHKHCVNIWAGLTFVCIRL